MRKTSSWPSWHGILFSISISILFFLYFLSFCFLFYVEFLLNTDLFFVFYRNFMNDALRTNVFVRYQPETIACACIFLSARQLKVMIMIMEYMVCGDVTDLKNRTRSIIYCWETEANGGHIGMTT